MTLLECQMRPRRMASEDGGVGVVQGGLLRRATWLLGDLR